MTCIKSQDQKIRWLENKYAKGLEPRTKEYETGDLRLHEGHTDVKLDDAERTEMAMNNEDKKHE